MRHIGQVTLAIVLALAATAALEAAPFALETNNHDRTMHVLDLGTSPPTLYGPFFTSDELGTSDTSILDVAVTPDNRFALVSNFAGDTVYRIDLANPTAPSVEGSVGLSFSAEDIDIAPDGSFAMVTGGLGESHVALLDLAPFALTTTYTVTTSSAGASCVAIGPDGQTVVLCDSNNDRIIYGVVDPASGLMSESTLATGSFPVNAAFSPDGKTVIVANAGDTSVNVYQVTAPGTLVAGTPPSVGSGLPGGQQSIAFSPGGSEAYVLSEDPSPDQISVLDVLGPGTVILASSGAADLLGDASGAFRLGVDAIAVSPDGDLLLATNPSGTGSPSDDVSLVDLSTFGVTGSATNSDLPTGVATFAPASTAAPIPATGGPALLALGLLLAAGALSALRPSAG